MSSLAYRNKNYLKSKTFFNWNVKCYNYQYRVSTTFLVFYINSILVKICHYRAHDLSLYTVVSIFWHEHHKDWVPLVTVESVSFQHGMAELLRAPIPQRIPTRKLWCVLSSPDSDRHVSPKKKNARGAVEFQQHPPSLPQPHFPSFSTPTQSQQYVWVFEPSYWGIVFY